ncbi:MAG: hypothetical protein VKO21_12675 [Candidatus Sericytochromatia bacterium]|nr:hypothetical protein [Candidatus Sericytochromatia bacterium]
MLRDPARGETAQTSCVAFGMERWLYALVHAHGLPGAMHVVEAELARSEETES